MAAARFVKKKTICDPSVRELVSSQTGWVADCKVSK